MDEKKNTFSTAVAALKKEHFYTLVEVSKIVVVELHAALTSCKVKEC